MTATANAADAVSEMASFSVFDKIDLAVLAKGDAKTVRGPSMSNARYLSVQSCYVASGSPAQQVQAQKKWNPSKYRDLKISLYAELPSAPSPEDFSRLQKAGDGGAVRSLVAATEKMSSDMQISREEAKKFSPGESKGGGAVPAAVANFWGEILSERARSIVTGGTSAQPPYDHTGENVRPGDELNGLLKQQDKVRRRFSSFLGETGIGRGAGPLHPDLYWELLEVDNQGVLTLGATYGRAGSGGTHQVADVLYYASGGYYVALTLFQMWPVTVEGKPCTLVWRGDLISSAGLSSLRGVEKLASESVMVKDISKAIAIFRRENR
jgi:hypothetical protein